MKKLNSIVVAAFLLIYFSSGFAALLYQVIWQRMLAIFSGSDLFATTMIVASFMAGLGFGSVCGGAAADRVTFRGQIGLFVMAEALTGAFGWISRWWYYDVVYGKLGQLPDSPVLIASILFGSLLVPTFLMGLTLPLLSRAITPAIEQAGRRIGSIYGWNTLGAATGALATAWVFMGRFDFPQILKIGAAVNGTAAVLTLILGVLLSKEVFVARAEGSGGAPQRPASSAGFSFTTWTLIYGLSGFVALSLEIVWFRVLGVMLKSNSLTFPHLLGIYLVCLACGVFLGSYLVRFAGRAADVFLAMQAMITIYTALAIIAMEWGIENLSFLNWLREYLDGYNPFDVSPARRGIDHWIAWRAAGLSFVNLYILVPLSLIGPPSLLMGMSFPFLQQSVQDSREFLGRRVGWLQGANIFGSTLGALMVGGLFLGVFGTAWTLRLLLVLGGVFPVLFVRRLVPAGRSVRPATLALVAVLAVLAGMIPSANQLWATLHGSPREHVIVTEGGSGLSVLKNQDPAFSAITWVYTNGLGQSWFPYGAVSVIHSRLGALPALIHPAPKEIAVIGLGSGDTLFSVGGRPETVEITCIEIMEEQLHGLRLLHQRKPYAELGSLLNDKRIRYVFGDGRRFLAASPKKYDIIEADALRATSAFAGNLYSLEYFQLLKSRLKPGGLALTWAPTHRTLETFMKVFPHVFNFDSVVVGSEQPIEFDVETLRRRMAHPFTQAYYAKGGLDMDAVVAPFFARKVEALRADHRQFSLSDWNTDLFPKDEYPR